MLLDSQLNTKKESFAVHLIPKVCIKVSYAMWKEIYTVNIFLYIIHTEKTDRQHS